LSPRVSYAAGWLCPPTAPALEQQHSRTCHNLGHASTPLPIRVEPTAIVFPTCSANERSIQHKVQEDSLPGGGSLARQMPALCSASGFCMQDQSTAGPNAQTCFFFWIFPLQRHKELEEEKKRVGRQSSCAAARLHGHMDSMPAKAWAHVLVVIHQQLQLQQASEARSQPLQICSCTHDHASVDHVAPPCCKG
jgi:hypothetical protein